MRRQRSKIEVSLFPFLSVLCTVIGVLILFIVLVLSTRVVVEDERYQQTETQLGQAQAGQPQSPRHGIDAESFAALERELGRLASLLQQRERERDDLTARLQGLEALIKTRKTELLLPRALARPKELDRPERVAVVPDASYQVDLRPILVEVSLHGYTVYPERKHFPPIRKTPSPGQELHVTFEKELVEYLREVDRRKEKEYLVLLVHPNGVEAFNLLRVYLADQHPKLNLGWEPFRRQWILADQTGP